MNFISYAPNFEDVMLWRALRGVGSGFYLDVGAADPLRASVTRAFYERGWRGVNLEPAAELHARLGAARPADVNLAVLAGAHGGEALFFDAGDSGRSGADQARAQAARGDGVAVLQRGRPQRTLDQICAEHADGAIHFVNIAVNGDELAVLEGFDLARWRPWLVLLGQQGDGAACAARMDAAGYRLAYDDGQKRYYVAPGHAALAAALALPPHAADAFTLAEDHHYAWPLDEWRQRTAAAEQSELDNKTWLAAHQQGWEQRIAEADTRLAQSQHDLAHTEQALADARALHAAAEAGRLAAVDARLDAEQARAADAAQAAAAQVDAAWALANATERYEAALAATRARAEHAEAAHAIEHANGRRVEAELAAIYASLAWRVTRPVRGVTKAGRYLRRQLRHRWWQARDAVARLRRNGRGALLGLFKRLVRRGIRFITERPALAFFLRRQIGRSPRLVGLLRAVAMRAKPAVPAAESAAPPVADNLQQLSAPARQAYHELQQALQRSRHVSAADQHTP